MKCTKIYNARAQLLFCSLDLLFSAVLVAVVVEICLSSLFSDQKKKADHICYDFIYDSQKVFVNLGVKTKNASKGNN